MESLERIYEMDADIFVSLKLVCFNSFQHVIDKSYPVCLLHTRWHIYFDHHGVNFMFSDQELLFQCLQLTVRSLLCSEKTIWYNLPNEGLLVKCQFSQEPDLFLRQSLQFVPMNVCLLLYVVFLHFPFTAEDYILECKNSRFTVRLKSSISANTRCGH